MKVLIIEDDVVHGEMIGRVLDKLNLEVMIARNGDEGLQAFYADCPDIVITDIYLPQNKGPGGLGIIEAIRRDSSVPIIAVSAGFSPELERAVKELGGNVVVPKPFNISNLVTMVQDLLNDQPENLSHY